MAELFISAMPMVTGALGIPGITSLRRRKVDCDEKDRNSANDMRLNPHTSQDYRKDEEKSDCTDSDSRVVDEKHDAEPHARKYIVLNAQQEKGRQIQSRELNSVQKVEDNNSAGMSQPKTNGKFNFWNDGLFKKRRIIKRKDSGRTEEEIESIGRSLSLQGEALAAVGRWNDAFNSWNGALQKIETSLGSNHPRMSQTLVCRGTALEKLGRNYEAILDIEKALHVQQRYFGEDDPDVAQTLQLLGKLQQQQGNDMEALQCLHTAVEIQERNHGKNHPEVASAVCDIAFIYHQRRRYSEARNLYVQALEIYECLGLPRDHPNVKRILCKVSDKNLLASCVTDYWTSTDWI